MQIVIEIPDRLYDNLPKIHNGSMASKALLEYVKNGTPLPKGHGRLIDADKLNVELEYGIRAGNYEEGYDKYAHINNMDDCVDAVVYADTIIEADNKYEAKAITRGNCMMCGKELTDGLFFCKECEGKGKE